MMAKIAIILILILILIVKKKTHLRVYKKKAQLSLLRPCQRHAMTASYNGWQITARI